MIFKKISLFSKMIILLTFSMLLLRKALALPTIYGNPSTQNYQLVNETTSILIADTEDDRLIHVAPPLMARSEFGELTMIGSNIGFCQSMILKQQVNEKLDQQLEPAIIETEDMKKQMSNFRMLISQQNEKLNQLSNERIEFQQLNALDTRTDQIELRLTALYTEMNNCNESEKCQEIQQEIKQLRSEKNDLSIKRNELVVKIANDYSKYKSIKARIVEYKEQLVELESEIINKVKKIQEIQKLIFDSYSQLSQLYGARVSLNFNSSWFENIQQLSLTNPAFHFQAIPTYDVQIKTNLFPKNSQTFLAALDPVMSFQIAGEEGGKDIQLPAFPGSFNGMLVLNLIGTCPQLFPEKFNLQKNTDHRIKLGLTVAYKIPSTFNQKVTFSYNLNTLFKKLLTSGSRGGFFRTKSWSKVQETELTEEDFKVHWQESDPMNQTTAEERQKVESEIKAELFKRALIYIGKASPEFISPPQTPVNGAKVLTQGLDQCSLISQYCMLGGWIFRGLDSIFGGSMTTAEYQRIQNVRLTETFEADQVRLVPWVTTFSNDK